MQVSVNNTYWGSFYNISHLFGPWIVRFKSWYAQDRELVGGEATLVSE